MQIAGVKTVNLSVDGTIEKIEDQRELILFRIVQESIHAFTNGVDNSFIQAKVIFNKEILEIIIGAPYLESSSFISKNQGNDWQTIKARAKLINATFNCTGTPEAGLKIYIYLSLIN